MLFEHTFEVNSPDESALLFLGREELWFGLLCRAEDARPFLPGLERCRIIERYNNKLTRELRFGLKVIRDRVSLYPPDRICFETEATPEHVGGSLTISIEEPEADRLFLRFCYRTGLDETGQKAANIAGIIRSAYYHADLETLRVIREIARSGKMQ